MHEGKNGHPSSPTTTTDLMALEDEEEMPVEYFCGIGKCRPRCLQIFRSAKFFTFMLSCYALVEGAIASGNFIAKLTHQQFSCLLIVSKFFYIDLGVTVASY